MKGFEYMLSNNMNIGYFQIGSESLDVQKRGLMLELINIRIEQLIMKVRKDNEKKEYQAKKIEDLVQFAKESIINRDLP